MIHRLLPPYVLLLLALSFAPVAWAQTSVVRQAAGPLPPTTDVSSVQGTAVDEIFFPNIHIFNNGQENETGIAVNPRNPLQLVAVANDFSHCNGMPYSYSSDGGLTWTVGCLARATSAAYNNAFDPTVCYDSRGYAFICYGDYRPVGGDEYQNGLFVSRSTDGGKTFGKSVGVYENLQNVKAGGGGLQPFEDKFYITADATPTSPNKDNLYVAWTHFPAAGASQVYSARSTDGGQTWSAPVSVSRDNLAPQGSIPTCGPNGEVYVAWGEKGFSPTAALTFARSENGGLSFGPPTQITNVQGVGTFNTTIGRMELEQKQNMRIATFPVIAVDNSNGPNKGRLYLAYHGLDNGVAHCFVRSSTDKGISWTPPKIIDRGDAGLDVYMPSIAVDPVTGMVVVDYYDSRNSPNNDGFDLYCSLSRDGFATWDEFRITSVTTKAFTLGQGTSGGNYFGDYQAITAYNGTAWPCWWDCRDGLGYNACHLFTAQIRSSPQSVTNLSASTSCSDPTVTLAWTDPTQTTTRQQLTDFSIIIKRNGAQIGTVAKGAQTYSDETAVAGTSYTYTVIVSDGSATSLPAPCTIIAGNGVIPGVPSAFRCRPVTGGVEVSWINPATHTDGTPLCDLAVAYIYSDTLLIDSVALTPSQAGLSASGVVRLDSTKAYFLQVRLGTRRGAVAAKGDTTSHYFTFAGAPRPSLAENFDTSPIMYASGTWAVSTKAARSTPNALTDSPTGKYGRNKTTYCVLPPTVLTAPDTTLSFAHILLSEPSADAALEITNDNGMNWTAVRGYTQANYPTDWHDSVSVSSWHLDHRSLHVTTAGKLLANIGDTIMIRFRLTTKLGTADGWYIDDITLGPTGADAVMPGMSLPSEYTLAQNSPNPFRGATEFAFTLASPARVRLEVTDILGREIATLVDGLMDAGSHVVPFSAGALPAGTYIYTLRGPSGTIARQMVVVR
jgi:hypothetical protein